MLALLLIFCKCTWCQVRVCMHRKMLALLLIFFLSVHDARWGLRCHCRCCCCWLFGSVHNVTWRQKCWHCCCCCWLLGSVHNARWGLKWWRHCCCCCFCCRCCYCVKVKHWCWSFFFFSFFFNHLKSVLILSTSSFKLSFKPLSSVPLPWDMLYMRVFMRACVSVSGYVSMHLCILSL